ncbi:uncharacterized protein LOC110827656 isoform X2 [Zootermopsis nevadensis]|uniref:uncharacterized protein LOC110827656 isoform X2 n=1 Tax=Zootermopsis nevadensis TaxID=136037 RepID=UPI000B8EA7C3|nr:uncharacterized protein LOC110827656 isoform X2 [Zootermopsis nevadensis]
MLGGFVFSEAIMRFSVELRLPRYVKLGDHAELYCDYNVREDQLHRVEWLRNGKKLFQYVKGRTPPFRNFTIPGAELDLEKSNERQILLKNMQFESSGSYSCEVSTQTPIYTKPSNDHELLVIETQRDPPEVLIPKSAYQVGERLEVNCTSSPARPVADITWLVNGIPVKEDHLRFFHSRDRKRLTAQLSLVIMERDAGPKGRLELTCLSTIPAFRALEHSEYGDLKTTSITVDIEVPQSGSRADSWFVLLLTASLFIFLR